MVGWSREEIIERNRQFKRYADSRKEIFVADKQRHRAELIQIVNDLKANNPPMPKSEKERLLRRVRQLESLTGVNVGDYNSPDFGSALGRIDVV